MEVGMPFLVPEDLVVEYQSDRRAAVAKLLALVEKVKLPKHIGVDVDGFVGLVL